MVICESAFAYNPKGNQEYVFPINNSGRSFPYTVYKTEKDARFETNEIHLEEDEYFVKRFYLEDLKKESVYGKELYKMTIETDEEYYIPELPVYIASARTFDESLEFIDITSNKMHIIPDSELYVVSGFFCDNNIYFELNNGYLITKAQFDGIRDIIHYGRIYEETDYFIDYFFSVGLEAFREDNGLIRIYVSQDNIEGLQLISFNCYLDAGHSYSLWGSCFIESERDYLEIRDVILVSDENELSLAPYSTYSQLPSVLGNNLTEVINFDCVGEASVIIPEIIEFLLCEHPKIKFIGKNKTVEITPNSFWLRQNLHLINFHLQLISVINGEGIYL